jgi:hypothetical protein
MVAWEVEVTDEFKTWWSGLTEPERVSVERAVLVLEDRGPQLPFPYSSRVNDSRHSAMRELRIQHQLSGIEEEDDAKNDDKIQ